MKALHLSFPIPIHNTLTPQNQKLFHIPSSSPQIPSIRCRFPPLLAAKADGVAVKETSSSEEAEPIPEGLRRDLMPRHVAVIMDGNGRWARQRGWLTSRGHEAGTRSLMEIIRLCGHWGIKVLTVFAFSCDNWTRPEVGLFSEGFILILELWIWNQWLNVYCFCVVSARG